MTFVILIALPYLLGSIPFGYLIAKYNNVDIQKVGSKNIGATNVIRAVSWQWGLVTLACDVAKGYLAVCLVDFFFFQPPVDYYILAGSMAVLGHFKPVWLRWKGGKTVATSLGVLLGLLPFWFLLVAIGIFIFVFALTGFVSLASMSAALSATITKIIFGGGFNQQNYPITLFVAGVMVLIIIAHKDNIRRLYKGTENKIKFPFK